MVKKDFNWIEIYLLIGIKNCKNIKELTINDISKELEINRSHPYLYRIISYLIENDTMILTKVIGSVKFYKINYNKIKELLDEQERINYLIANYINKDHIFEW